MKNRQLFLKDPIQSELLNNGVAEVRDIQSQSELQTLRYELETFVCEGQYATGLARILGSYLRNLDKPEQPAVWVGGFFGSGKSHLVKMLCSLWVDFEIPDKATARGIAKLPTDITDLLRELSTAGKRCGNAQRRGWRERPAGTAQHHLSFRWSAGEIPHLALCHMAQATRHLRTGDARGRRCRQAFPQGIA